MSPPVEARAVNASPETRSKFVSPNREIGSDPQVKVKVAAAIMLVYEGTYLKNALKQTGLTRHLFASCLSGERELSALYAQARKVSADFLVDEAIDAVMNEENQLKARNIADMNRWAAGKFDSKYNDKIDINVTQTLDISGALLEARKRLQSRPVSDQQLIEDAQYVDVQGLSYLGPTDKESVPAGEPDIFGGEAAHIDEAAQPGQDYPDIFS